MKYLLTLFFMLCASVQAQADSQLKKIRTSSESRGWEAVGRLDFAESSFCTGSLISPTLVLTAAHCLYDIDTNVLHKAETIKFRAGFRNGETKTYHVASNFYVHPDFSNSAGTNTSRLNNDVALVELAQPVISGSVFPFPTAQRPSEGAIVGVVSYAHDRANSPSLQETCQVLARQGDVLVTSCDVDYGSSGAPIFTMSGGRPKIVSVVAAKARFRGEKVSVGTALETTLAPLMRMAISGRASFEKAEAEGALDEISHIELVSGALPQ